MFSPDGLTPVERAVQGMQVREVRCGACLHRGVQVLEGHWSCLKELSWPPGRRRKCPKFSLDEDA